MKPLIRILSTAALTVSAVILVTTAYMPHCARAAFYRNYEYHVHDTSYKTDSNDYILRGWMKNLDESNHKRTWTTYFKRINAQSQIGNFEMTNDENGYFLTQYAADADNEIEAQEDDIEENEEQYQNLTAVITNDAGEVRTIDQSEIDDNRENGWYIKQYSKGLDNLMYSIDNYIRGLNGSWGVYVKNLNNGKNLVLNDGRYSTASIIKLFVMSAAYNEIAYGGISKNARVSELLEQMITVSDNYASNQLVKIIGGGDYKRGFEAENANTKSAGCLNTRHYSLFIGFGDYVSYGKNFVSPIDCGIILEKIYEGTLVSKEYSEEMLELLKKQQIRNKIPYPLPEGTVTANKTGETNTVQSDVGIVYSPACDYIICVISNNSRSGISGIREISKMTYDYLQNDN